MRNDNKTQIVFVPWCHMGTTISAKTDRVLSGLWFLIVALFVAGFMFFIAKSVVSTHRYATWAPADAAIVQSETGADVHHPVHYAYFAQGEERRGTYTGEKERRAFALTGAKLVCRVNPGNAAEAVLFWSPKPYDVFKRMNLVLGLSLLFFVPGCFLLFKGKRAPWFTAFTALHLGFALFMYWALLHAPADAFVAARPFPTSVVLAPSLTLFLISLLFLLARVRIKNRWSPFFLPSLFLGAGLVMAGLEVLLPGVAFATVGFAWLWWLWPKRKVVLERGAGRFVTGNFVFPCSTGEITEAEIHLEAKQEISQGNSIILKTRWEQTLHKQQVFCDGTVCRLAFAFDDPRLFDDRIQWHLTLTLRGRGRPERYRFQLAPETWSWK